MPKDNTVKYNPPFSGAVTVISLYCLFNRKLKYI